MDIRKKILEESFVRGSISKEEMTRQIQEMDGENVCRRYNETGLQKL